MTFLEAVAALQEGCTIKAGNAILLSHGARVQTTESLYSGKLKDILTEAGVEEVEFVGHTDALIIEDGKAKLIVGQLPEEFYWRSDYERVCNGACPACAPKAEETAEASSTSLPQDAPAETPVEESTSTETTESSEEGQGV